MNITVTQRQYDLIREALEIHYYRYREEGDTETMEEVEELKTYLSKLHK